MNGFTSAVGAIPRGAGRDGRACAVVEPEHAAATSATATATDPTARPFAMAGREWRIAYLLGVVVARPRRS
jgi:hypothetical protein